SLWVLFGRAAKGTGPALVPARASRENGAVAAGSCNGETGSMPTIDEALAEAVRRHQAGDLRRAEEVYRQVLQADPANADAWHLLGVAAHHAGRNEEAIQNIGRAIALDARQAVFHSNLGLAHPALGRPA